MNLKQTIESPWFRTASVAAIVLNSLLMGIETSQRVSSSFATELFWLHVAFQVVFVAEIALRISAHGSKPLEFFRNGWNVFDFSVVAVSLLPAAGPLATIVRLARIFRVLRVLTAFPELRLIIATMLRSIPSMGHVIALMGLLMYMYAIIGFYKFSAIDPENWGNLGRAFQTLFQILTLDGWAELQAPIKAQTSWSWVFFYSYTILAVFVVVNLFIAVVINNLDKAKNDQLRESETVPTAQNDLLSTISLLESQLLALKEQIQKPN